MYYFVCTDAEQSTQNRFHSWNAHETLHLLMCSFCLMTIFNVSLHNGSAKTYRYQIKCANMHFQTEKISIFLFIFVFFFSVSFIFQCLLESFSFIWYSSGKLWPKCFWKRKSNEYHCSCMTINDRLELEPNVLVFFLLAVFVWNSLHCTSPKLDIH